jgi:hypothetical protein
VSKTRTVTIGGRGFWAYDVSVSLLLAETIRVGMELSHDQQPSWLPEALDKLRTLVIVTDFGVAIDDDWPSQGVDLLVQLINEANRRLAARGSITAAEVAEWKAVGADQVHLRGAEVVDLSPVVELGQATVQLIHGTLPPPPAGTWWFYGNEGGPRTIGMREPT